MKSILTIFFCLLLFSCNNKGDTDKNAAAASTEEIPFTSSTEKEVASNKGTLDQRGDYTKLFDREPNNCDFITAENLATALEVPITLINEGYTSCIYNLTEANGTKTIFKFSIEAWSNKTILKEIKQAKENAENFGKDSKLSQYRLSQTGDTYLSMHQNRMIRILNEKSTNAIIIFYTIDTSSIRTGTGNISEEKDIARERSYAIANYLLSSYKQ